MLQVKSARTWVAVALLGLGVAFAACYPGEVTSIAQLDVVATTHDSTANFALPTFAIPDTVLQPFEDSAGAIPLPRDFDDLMVSLVVQNMEARGYTRITDTTQIEDADYVLLISAIGLNQDYYVYYPGWCGGWGPGWGWWGGCWGGWYPGYVGKGSYETGTVFIDMGDPSEFDPEQEAYPIYWVAAFRGLLGTSSQVTQQRITDLINQAFTQSSSYLTRN